VTTHPDINDIPQKIEAAFVLIRLMTAAGRPAGQAAFGE